MQFSGWTRSEGEHPASLLGVIKVPWHSPSCISHGWGVKREQELELHWEKNNKWTLHWKLKPLIPFFLLSFPLVFAKHVLVDKLKMVLVLWCSSKELSKLSKVFQIYCHVSIGFISQHTLHLPSTCPVTIWPYKCIPTDENKWQSFCQTVSNRTFRGAACERSATAPQREDGDTWKCATVFARGDGRPPGACCHAPLRSLGRCRRFKRPHIENLQSRLCRSHSVAHMVANNLSQNGGEGGGFACCFGTSPIDSSVKAPWGPGGLGDAAVCYNE